jgi:phosphoesterase RecJ-like protein
MEASTMSSVPLEAGESDEGELARCVAALARTTRPLIAMHEFPDGDALGSALALGLLLEARGARVTVYSPQGAPPNLRFLPGAERIVRSIPEAARFDLCIACDAGDPSRLGTDLPPPERRGPTVNLDHHAGVPRFGEVNLVDGQASSTGVLVYRVMKRMGASLTEPVATCLWVSLVSDTGSFRYSNTNAECLRIAHELVEAGVRPGEISSRLFESQPLDRVRLLAEVLRTLSLSPCRRIAWLTAHSEAFALAGTTEETVDGFVAYPRSIEGVEVALLFRQEAGGARVSLRSRGAVDVGAIALGFGGGGHHNASGCFVEGGLGEVRAKVLREVERALVRPSGP